MIEEHVLHLERIEERRLMAWRDVVLGKIEEVEEKQRWEYLAELGPDVEDEEQEEDGASDNSQPQEADIVEEIEYDTGMI
jgi:hypothetical protein